MKACVIVIEGHPDSERCAARTIETGRKFGITVERFRAVTPADDPAAMFEARGWPTGKFTHNRFSRPLPCMACFLSHATLWHHCAYSGESHLILEHDAVFVRELPVLRTAGLLVNLAKPSFGTFRTPPCGIGPLRSKPFMPGATGYYIHHRGAEQLLARAKHEAEPTDVFMSIARFPFIRESYPWCIECEDEVSTVQREEGCKGKHNTVRIA